MCGRFSLRTPAAILVDLFQLAQSPAWAPRYNIAPTQPVPIVLMTTEHPDRQFKHCRWGLIPGWAKGPDVGARMINAKAETASSKPAFRANPGRGGVSSSPTDFTSGRGWNAGSNRFTSA